MLGSRRSRPLAGAEAMTDAGKRLRGQIAYHIDPSSYLPGDYVSWADEDIAAIEAEAVAAERQRIKAAVERLIEEAGGLCVAPDDGADFVFSTHSELLSADVETSGGGLLLEQWDEVFHGHLFDDGLLHCENDPRQYRAILAVIDGEAT
jgi:hypothetical protein